MQRNYFWILSVVIILNGIFHTGALLKGESKYEAIAESQTDPITHKAKMEELKEGPKGAPSPSFAYYGNKKILSELPMEKLEKEGVQGPSRLGIPDLGEPIPEDLSGFAKEDQTSEEDDWWFDEWEEEASQDSSGSDEFGI